MVKNARVMKNGKVRNHAFVLFVHLVTKSRTKTQDVLNRVTFTLPPVYANRERTVITDKTMACRNSKNYFEC